MSSYTHLTTRTRVKKKKQEKTTTLVWVDKKEKLETREQEDEPVKIQVELHSFSSSSFLPNFSFFLELSVMSVCHCSSRSWSLSLLLHVLSLSEPKLLSRVSSYFSLLFFLWNSWVSYIFYPPSSFRMLLFFIILDVTDKEEVRSWVLDSFIQRLLVSCWDRTKSETAKKPWHEEPWLLFFLLFFQDLMFPFNRFHCFLWLSLAIVIFPVELFFSLKNATLHLCLVSCPFIPIGFQSRVCLVHCFKVLSVTPYSCHCMRKEMETCHKTDWSFSLLN